MSCEGALEMYIRSMTFGTASSGIAAFPILKAEETSSKASFKSFSRNKWRVGWPSSDAWNVFLGPRAVRPKKDMAEELLRLKSFEDINDVPAGALPCASH